MAVLSEWLIWSASRLLAVCLTLLLILTTTGISVDLVWWQCSNAADACSGLPDWMISRLTSWNSGTTLVLAAVVPAALLFALWAISRSTIGRYESVRESQFDDDVPDLLRSEVALKSPSMWNNKDSVHRLRALHLQAGTALILWVVASASGQSIGWQWTSWSWLTGVALPGAVAVYVAAVLIHPHVSARRQWGVPVIWTVWGLLLIGVAFQTWMLLAGDVPADEIPSGGARYYEDTLTWLLTFTCGTAAVLVFVVVCAAVEQGLSLTPETAPANSAVGGVLADDSEHAALRPGVWGLASALLAMLGVLLAAALSAAVYSYAATWLNSGLSRPTPETVSRALGAFAPPDAFGAAAAAIAYSAAFALLVVIMCGLVIAWKVGPLPLLKVRVRPESAFASDYVGDTATKRTDPRRRSIERAMYLGTVVETIPPVAAWLAFAGTLISLTVGIAVLADATGVAVPLAADGVESIRAEPQDSFFGSALGPTVQGWGAFIALWSLVGVVTLGALAFRVPATRRTVGVLWDVASFWPRTVHPLAAPCYAERAVPDLVNRLVHLTEEERNVVLAGHSQGSILSAAAAFRMAESHTDLHDRVALLTFGCVLRRLYGRMFPQYFGPAELVALEACLTDDNGRRWMNLWRYTDYLGGQVTAGPPQSVPTTTAHEVDPDVLLTEPPVSWPTWEWHSPDPPVFGRLDGDTAYVKPSRHSEYWSDRSGVYQLAVVTLVRRLDRVTTAPHAMHD